MYGCMERVLVYLARTSHFAIVYSGKGEDARKLKVRADSDWSVDRSTTGYYISLAGATIAHGSKRQHCVAMSSTEAEMMALADAAMELMYVTQVLTLIGFEFEEIDLDVSKPETHELFHKVWADVPHHDPIEVETDNKGAHDLCHRHTTGPSSRHVQRKVNKMRELQHDGSVRVGLIPTDKNASDLFTKVLGNQKFAEFRATIYNLAAMPKTDEPRNESES
jgi:acetyl/propionyl-CoA carboxylase alpha subunit